jgi:predicted AAA+ superfamily ATPase
VLTGSRQTGKTTLARQAFPDLPYISFEDPISRPNWSHLSASDWVEHYPHAVLDEVQKAPAVIETIRAAYDLSDQARYLLLGSSQILLLSKIKESLAGRAIIEELWPLTLPEMATASWEDELRESRLIQWLRSGRSEKSLLLGVPSASRTYSRFQAIFDRYLKLGGMPAVHDPELTDEEREEWLNNFQRTYLERDVADLAALRDLEPFVLAQKAIALRTGTALNYSDLARDASISPGTAQRFLRYLELSYQVLILQPYYRNQQKRLAKMPKVHFLDPGIQRCTVKRRGPLAGAEFESAVVAEIVKQIRSALLPADFYHLRTHDGREVDLLIEMEKEFVAIEVKSGAHVSKKDARHLRDLESFLDKPLRKSLILSMDREIRELDAGILALPAAWILGG